MDALMRGSQGQHLLVSNGISMLSSMPHNTGMEQHLGVSMGATHGQVQVLQAAAPGTQYVLLQQPTNVGNLPMGVFPVGMHALGNRRAVEPSYDSDDSEEGDGRGGKGKRPQMQGRFSGRLALKEDERRLADECRLLAPLLGGAGKRGDKSRLTLAKIVRGIASGAVRRHCEERENQLMTFKIRCNELEHAQQELSALKDQFADMKTELELFSQRLTEVDPDPSVVQLQVQQALKQQRQQRAAQRAAEAQLALQQQQQQQQQQHLAQYGFAPQGTVLLNMHNGAAGGMFTAANVAQPWSSAPAITTMAAPAATSSDWHVLRLGSSNTPGGTSFAVRQGTAPSARPAAAPSIASGSTAAAGMVLNLQTSNSINSQGPPAQSPFCISAPAGVNLLQQSGSMPRSFSDQVSGAGGNGSAGGAGLTDQGGNTAQQAEPQFGMHLHNLLPMANNPGAGADGVQVITKQEEGGANDDKVAQQGHRQQAGSNTAQIDMSQEEMSVAQQLQQMAAVLQQHHHQQQDEQQQQLPPTQQPSSSPFLSTFGAEQALGILQQQQLQQQLDAHAQQAQAQAHAQTQADAEAHALQQFQQVQHQYQHVQPQPQQIINFQFQARPGGSDGMELTHVQE